VNVFIIIENLLPIYLLVPLIPGSIVLFYIWRQLEWHH